MHDLLFCCLLSRIYETYRNPSQISNLIANTSPNWYQDIFDIFLLSAYSLSERDIHLRPSNTASQYGDIVTTRYCVNFVDYSAAHSIPKPIIDIIQAIFDRPLHRIPQVRFGFLGRHCLLNPEQKYIQYGLQLADDTILMDYEYISKMDLFAFVYHISHELLHCFGFEEEEVVNDTFEFVIQNMHVLVDAFAPIYTEGYNLYPSFQERVKKTSDAEANLFTYIQNASTVLSNHGYPAPPLEPQVVQVPHPLTSESIDLLFC